ncbi:MAG TPA: molybdenum cofactor biosynthesis protein B [bacterium]|nr:MAG: Molybdenum cofactor biosynthesis protein B [bacterium ADurb.Bin236]HOY62425.1 molybdenum cofactor biosynthesis protein B [bacterium]HPI75375.1 molybdenum cofactor biosynthesis protein B [bacterium]HPN95813.1 molybdenum cofactor biosynthesis protein B [bacterium]
MGHKDHKEKARGPVGVLVMTVSDTRTEETDESGALIKALLAEAGHEVAGYEIMPDEPSLVAKALAAPPAGVSAAIINGGTGISKRDSTFDAVRSALSKELPGFGELFRMLSYEQIGAAAIMSRATAGITTSGLAVFSIPGSIHAVRLAMEKIILPELSHIVWEAGR